MIAAILSGPSYFSPNHDERHIEVFNHLGEVVDALFHRYSSNGKHPCTVNTLDGKTERVLFPTFGEGSQFTCYEIDTPPAAAGFPAFHEELVMDVLTAVHMGAWDYDVEIVATDSELLTVNIEKAGVS